MRIGRVWEVGWNPPPGWILALLGAFHGLNPGMGWLFAVSRGLQERQRREVVRSLWPIALGHELAIGVTVVLVVGLEAVTDPAILRGAGTAMLVGFGLSRSSSRDPIPSG